MFLGFGYQKSRVFPPGFRVFSTKVTKIRVGLGFGYHFWGSGLGITKSGFWVPDYITNFYSLCIIYARLRFSSFQNGLYSFFRMAIIDENVPKEAFNVVIRTSANKRYGIFWSQIFYYWKCLEKKFLECLSWIVHRKKGITFKFHARSYSFQKVFGMCLTNHSALKSLKITAIFGKSRTYCLKLYVLPAQNNFFCDFSNGAAQKRHAEWKINFKMLI